MGVFKNMATENEIFINHIKETTMEIPKAIVSALVTCQAQFAAAPKLNKVNYGTTQYKYADLNNVLEVIKPVINKNGLAIMQLPIMTDKEYSCKIKNIVIHESGVTWSWDSGEIRYSAGKTNISQAYGSAMTYLKRYCLTSLFGLVMEDEDNDANDDKVTISQVKKKITNAADMNDLAAIKELSAIKQTYSDKKKELL